MRRKHFSWTNRTIQLANLYLQAHSHKRIYDPIRLHMLMNRMQSPKAARAKTEKSRIPSKVAHECGFRFFTSTGDYTGVTSHSIEEFAANLRTITLDSVTFHFERADFQKWIRNVLCDPKLAERMGRIGAEFSGESLRKKLVEIVEARLIELRSP